MITALAILNEQAQEANREQRRARARKTAEAYR